MRAFAFGLAGLIMVGITVAACGGSVTGGGSGGSGSGTSGAGTGAGSCSVPAPQGMLGDDCGGSGAVGSGGNMPFTCEFFCRDSAQQEYGVECSGTNCKCKLNGQVVCECNTWDGSSCTTPCCPEPWFNDPGSGGSGGGTSSAAGGG